MLLFETFMNWDQKASKQLRFKFSLVSETRELFASAKTFAEQYVKNLFLECCNLVG
eukprot:UN18782